jgi:hypothetical protein
METNRIIEELRAKASLDWNPEQKTWFEQQAIKNHARRTGRGGQNTVWAIRG